MEKKINISKALEKAQEFAIEFKLKAKAAYTDKAMIVYYYAKEKDYKGYDVCSFWNEERGSVGADIARDYNECDSLVESLGVENVICMASPLIINILRENDYVEGKVIRELEEISKEYEERMQDEIKYLKFDNGVWEGIEYNK